MDRPARSRAEEEAQEPGQGRQEVATEASPRVESRLEAVVRADHCPAVSSGTLRARAGGEGRQHQLGRAPIRDVPGDGCAHRRARAGAAGEAWPPRSQVQRMRPHLAARKAASSVAFTGPGELTLVSLGVALARSWDGGEHFSRQRPGPCLTVSCAPPHQPYAIRPLAYPLRPRSDR